MNITKQELLDILMNSTLVYVDSEGDYRIGILDDTEINDIIDDMIRELPD